MTRKPPDMILRGVNLTAFVMLGIGGAYLGDCRANRWAPPSKCWETAMGWIVGGGLTRVGLMASHPPSSPKPLPPVASLVERRARRRPSPENPQE